MLFPLSSELITIFGFMGLFFVRIAVVGFFVYALSKLYCGGKLTRLSREKGLFIGAEAIIATCVLLGAYTQPAGLAGVILCALYYIPCFRKLDVHPLSTRVALQVFYFLLFLGGAGSFLAIDLPL